MKGKLLSHSYPLPLFSLSSRRVPCVPPSADGQTWGASPWWRSWHGAPVGRAVGQGAWSPQWTKADKFKHESSQRNPFSSSDLELLELPESLLPLPPFYSIPNSQSQFSSILSSLSLLSSGSLSKITPPFIPQVIYPFCISDEAILSPHCMGISTDSTKITGERLSTLGASIWT